MSYATLMVHLQPGRTNAGPLRAAADLADRFQAAVTGVAACQPMQLVYSDGYIAGDVFEKDREEKDREMAAAEAEFRAAFRTRSNTLDWRSTITLASTSEWVANEARGADLIITGVGSTDAFDPGRSVDTGEIVMRAGRPVLVVPPGTPGNAPPGTPGNVLPGTPGSLPPGVPGSVPSGADAPRLEHAMIGWKDTRETRRAVMDALPLLQKLARVSVVEVADADGMAAARLHVADVAAWLGRHGVAAEAAAVRADGDDAAQLDGIAQEQGADLVVAGAYGHSRLREWALGGVTRTLLRHTHRCSLLSH
jgi:nucleotide-binding universal stress UspA family protein